jgi:arsenite methyltransferase
VGKGIAIEMLQRKDRGIQMTTTLAPDMNTETMNATTQHSSAGRCNSPTGRSIACAGESGRRLAERLGYKRDELDAVPQGVVESFAGVGYCFDMAKLDDGDQVVDFGCGSGTDSFVAATKAGSEGRVVGVDITDELLEKANRLRTENGFDAVEFRKAAIEDTGLPAESFDTIISNGIVNLAANKDEVFREAARLLKHGGRLALSDIVTDFRPPEGVTLNATLWTAGICGALQIDEYIDAIEAAGFRIVNMYPNTRYPISSDHTRGAQSQYGARSVSVEAVRL